MIYKEYQEIKIFVVLFIFGMVIGKYLLNKKIKAVTE
jgi:hypothetical protein